MKCDELKTVCYIDAYSTMPVYGAKDVDAAIAELKAENERLKDEIKRLENVRKVHIEGIESMSEGLKLDAKQICKTQRALWLARAKAAKSWADYWFDIAPSENIKYDRIGRMEGVEKEFILTKVTKHMTASEWVGLWEKVDKLCRKKAEEYK